jgi:methionyl-tRNA formyltransferase
MRIVTFGSDHRHPLTTAALGVVKELDGIEHVDHVTREDEREFMRDPASPAFRSHLVNLRPDLFLSAAYARVLPEEVLAIPTLGAINVHPALLPAYRGVMAIWWALYERQSSVGVTIHEMTLPVDSGPILAQASLPVRPEENPGEVSPKVGELARPLLEKTLREITETGLIAGTPQRGAGSYRSTPGKEAHRLEIDWSQTARELVRRDRIFPGNSNIAVGRWRVYAKQVDQAGATRLAPGRILRRRATSIDVSVAGGSSVRLQLTRPLRDWVKLLILHASTGHFRHLERPNDTDSNRADIG